MLTSKQIKKKKIKIRNTLFLITLPFHITMFAANCYIIEKSINIHAVFKKY